MWCFSLTLLKARTGSEFKCRVGHAHTLCSEPMQWRPVASATALCVTVIRGLPSCEGFHSSCLHTARTIASGAADPTVIKEAVALAVGELVKAGTGGGMEPGKRGSANRRFLSLILDAKPSSNWLVVACCSMLLMTALALTLQARRPTCCWTTSQPPGAASRATTAHALRRQLCSSKSSVTQSA